MNTKVLFFAVKTDTDFQNFNQVSYSTPLQYPANLSFG